MKHCPTHKYWGRRTDNWRSDLGVWHQIRGKWWMDSGRGVFPGRGPCASRALLTRHQKTGALQRSSSLTWRVPGIHFPLCMLQVDPAFCTPTLYPKRRQFSWLDFLFLMIKHVQIGALAVPKFLESSFTHSFLLYSWRHQSYRSDVDFIRWTLRIAIFPGFREHITRISWMDNNTRFSVGKKKCPRHHCLLYPPSIIPKLRLPLAAL